jgi:hypothetical protein
MLNEFVDKDPTNCLSRLYMSNTSLVDSIFKIPEAFEGIGVPSDHSALESGSGAKIVLDSSGNIRILPGDDGKVFIGGDIEDPDSRIIPLGSNGEQNTGEPFLDDNNVAINVRTSAGGVVNEPGGSGRFSRKVVIK